MAPGEPSADTVTLAGRGGFLNGETFSLAAGASATAGRSEAADIPVTRCPIYRRLSLGVLPQATLALIAPEHVRLLYVGAGRLFVENLAARDVRAGGLAVEAPLPVDLRLGPVEIEFGLCERLVASVEGAPPMLQVLALPATAPPADWFAVPLPGGPAGAPEGPDYSLEPPPAARATTPATALPTPEVTGGAPATADRPFFAGTGPYVISTLLHAVAVLAALALIQKSGTVEAPPQAEIFVRTPEFWAPAPELPSDEVPAEVDEDPPATDADAVPATLPDAGETTAPDPGEGGEAATGEAAAIGIGGGSGPGPGAFDRPVDRPGGPAIHETAPPAEPVARALAWLARHQLADGSFGAEASIADCGCPDPGRRDYRVAMTGLATLAFLGGGSTHRDGPHAKSVRAAIAWLKAEQRENGGFFDRDTPEEEREMYGNAMALLALSEAQRRCPSPLLAVPIDRALDFFARTQISYSGWRYGPGDAVADASVTGWVAIAIAAAGRAGFAAEPHVRAGILDFFANVTDPATGRVGYRHRGRGSLAMTATGVAVRLAFGEARSARDLRAARALLAANPPSWTDVGPPPDFTYLYFGTLATQAFGGEGERSFNAALRAALLPRQDRGGETAGSWPATGRYDRVGGRVLATALAALCLEEASR